MTPIYWSIIIFLIFALWLSSRKIKWQDEHINEILREKSKMSDKLRLKGIAVDRLAGKIKKAEKDFNIRIVG